jgi:DNA-directed RNA polymerase specialized sigma24 family protein
MNESGEPASPALPSSDAELIKAVASGNAAAYATLHERHVAAARILARRVASSFVEAEEVLSETFSRLHGVLRRGAGGGAPAEALRPFLLTAVRRVAQERTSAGGAGAGDDIPSLGEPLFVDPEAADLESARLALAFSALPERQRAVLWHIEIEQADPAEVAALVGLIADGVVALADQARAALRQQYLKQYASEIVPEDCKTVADKLGEHLANATRGGDEAMVQRHLRGCRECRAVAIELGACGRSLRQTVAPIFLGPAAASYLAAVNAPAAAPGPAGAGLRWLRRTPSQVRRTTRQVGQAPQWIRGATRQQQALAGGVAMLAVVGVTGLTLTLAASSTPEPAPLAKHPVAIGPSRPSAAAPSSAAQPTPVQPVATTMPAKKATQGASPSPAAPTPTPSPTTSPAPSPTPSPEPTAPAPTPSPPPHHRHHHPPAGTT